MKYLLVLLFLSMGSCIYFVNEIKNIPIDEIEEQHLLFENIAQLEIDPLIKYESVFIEDNKELDILFEEHCKKSEIKYGKTDLQFILKKNKLLEYEQVIFIPPFFVFSLKKKNLVFLFALYNKQGVEIQSNIVSSSDNKKYFSFFYK